MFVGVVARHSNFTYPYVRSTLDPKIIRFHFQIMSLLRTSAVCKVSLLQRIVRTGKGGECQKSKK
jgi:hypothetical protein